MSALLTKTEATQIHAFLDTMDYDAYNVGKEWQMYQANADNDQYDKAQLTKATKDLMALDYPQYQHQPTYYYQQQQQQQPVTHYDYHYPAARQPSFPFLHQQQRPPPPPPHPLSIGASRSHSQYPTPTNTTPSTASPSSSGYSFPPDISPIRSPDHSRRPSPKSAIPAAGSVPPPMVASGSGSSSSKSRRVAPPPAKPALLSASQKKANHIQSEQKRRANIRRGYEALCESVPALQEAIREEEAAAAARSAPDASKAKRSRGRKTADDGGPPEKVDGRAGPRSENVVLSKTIDYLNELLADRDALRARLDRARAALPPGHPALTPETLDPLWEREWKGGLGNDGDDDDEDDSPS
ncbi:BHLH domain-containing protein [Mycena kentingensis (nom. inval.)]|nr:BHLH domain-containing protein [Mycena kentingensis (nom. inval.)]